MKNKTVEELRAMAKKLGLSGYSKLRKAELLKLLASNGRRTLAPTSLDETNTARPPRAEVSPSKRPAIEPSTAAASVAPPEAEQRVESAKFAFAPPGVSVPERHYGPDLGEDIDQLPAFREPLLCLLPQKPGVLHGYWTLPGDGSIAGGALHLRLARLHGDAIEILEERPLPSARGHWYFHVDANADPGAVYLQLGYYDAAGQFVSAMYRGIARIPSLYASDRTDRRWWVSEEQFRAMYRRAGGHLEGRRLGWAGSVSSPGGPPPSGERLAWPGNVSSR